ncbi:hypothetical protein [Burkholderia multivorans]|uniref:hypothetical protein n=1 Tax=Burkholderia multivorans TaxID=87883 RepID=UPI001C239F6F|nr:hypothetical protein [Burkholderia multivorans]MBU9490968.1 hypothetical protein [Burkholderia multivorans]
MGILRKSFAAAREEGPAGVVGYLAVFIPTALIVLPVKPAKQVQPVVEHIAGVIDLAAVRQLRGEKPSHEG